MATLKFMVEGMPATGRARTAAREAIMRTLTQAGLAAVHYDPDFEVFVVEADPARHSWSDLRRMVAILGERQGRIYLAVAMSQ